MSGIAIEVLRCELSREPEASDRRRVMRAATQPLLLSSARKDRSKIPLNVTGCDQCARALRPIDLVTAQHP